MSVNVRAAVGKALIRAEKEPEKAVRILDGVLDPIRDPRDRAFAARLFYTVLQNEKWLDWQLQRRCRTPLKDLQPAGGTFCGCARLSFFILIGSPRIQQ